MTYVPGSGKERTLNGKKLLVTSDSLTYLLATKRGNVSFATDACFREADQQVWF